jgi:hypothetical protein
MINFVGFLVEAAKIKDFIGGSGDSETERHRLQYFDDTHPEGSFNRINGRYVLNRDRHDLHPDYSSGAELKLEKIALLRDATGKMRYHGIIGDQAIPMSQFNKPEILKKRTGDTLRTENAQIDSISSQIKKAMEENGGRPIRVRTADGNVHEVAGIKAIRGAKADAYLHDSQGNPVHHMSLKGDTYQQWGGYTDAFDHPKMKEIVSRLQELKSKLSPGSKYLPPGSIYHHTLDKNDPEDRKIIMRAMYGRDHGGEYGKNNVNAIYGGNTVTLRRGEDGIHTLQTDALHVNRNDESSDVTDAKVMLHKSSGHDQAGTGGRITIQHAMNVPSSTSINAGVDDAIMNRRQSIGKPKPRSLSVAVSDTTETSEPTVAKKPTPQKPRTSTLGGLQLPS